MDLMHETPLSPTFSMTQKQVNGLGGNFKSDLGEEASGS